MIERGELTADDHVELLEGSVVLKMPKSPRHRFVNRRLRDLLEAILPAGWYVESQEQVTFPTSEPEPDISVIRGKPEDYATRHPGPGDVGMIAEVSESTLSRDRGLKGRIYLKAGIAVYWIVNLVDNQVEVYSATDSGVSPTIYRPGEAVPVIITGVEVGRVAADLFPQTHHD